ncbi:hypothetical protein [Nocardia sp. NPDC051463]|uniref:hypothetical protein n=1 Tax=Nocardia sp. NPDC051463 TaxID=3154845 RepID=UPI003414AE4E
MSLVVSPLEYDLRVFGEPLGSQRSHGELVAFYKRRLAGTAARVDAGYPSNTDLVLDEGKPVLKRRTGGDRRPEALKLQAAIHERLPHRASCWMC